ncbi:MAG: hypothetical protein GTO24_14450 [candidate division Zixibacteria bacterium]|nr:hypothetical protein [candidate division Zixibacteria bacterium]
MHKRVLIMFLFAFWAVPAFSEIPVDTVWVREYNGPGDGWDQARAMAVDGSGNVYATGHSLGPSPIDAGAAPDYATIKYDPSGNKLWVQRYDGPGDSEDYAYAVVADDLGNVYVTGMSIGEGTAGDYATIKYRPDGTAAWVRRYDGPANGWDYGRDIAIDGSGNVCVTGISMGSGTDPDFATIKYDSSGNELWVERYNGPGNGWDCALAITVDGSSNVYVTGYSLGDETGCDYTTIKYYPTGGIAWVRTYNGPGNDHDYGRVIVVDGSGNVYVTGDSWDSEAAFDYATIRYYPDGSTAWVARYNGSGDGCDYANAVAVDDRGNAYVTGQSRGNQTDFDYVTVKYDSLGSELWVKRENGPGDWDDCANAIAVDISGNVFITGVSLGSGSWYDYATIGYDSSGTELWSNRHNGPGNLGDYACAVAVDGFGNVYVTGHSRGSGTSSYDYATIRYYQCEGNNPPDAFSLFLPPNHASTPRGVHFDWETATDPDVSDAVRYDLYVSTSFHFPADSTTIDSNIVASEYIKMLDLGTHYWKVKARDNCGGGTWCDQVGYFTVTGIPHMAMGDLNSDGTLDVQDVVFCVNYLYRSGSAPYPLAAGDCNCDGVIDIGDAVHLINYLFKHGSPPDC